MFDRALKFGIEILSQLISSRVSIRMESKPRLCIAANVKQASLFRKNESERMRVVGLFDDEGKFLWENFFSRLSLGVVVVFREFSPSPSIKTVVEVSLLNRTEYYS